MTAPLPPTLSPHPPARAILRRSCRTPLHPPRARSLFFLLMWAPKYYVKPIQWPPYLETQQYDLDVKFWGGASPYEGRPHARRRDADPRPCSLSFPRRGRSRTTARA